MKFTDKPDDRPFFVPSPLATRVLAQCNRLLSALHPNTRPRDFIVTQAVWDKLAECFDDEQLPKAEIPKTMAVFGVRIRSAAEGPEGWVAGVDDDDHIMLRVWRPDYYINDGVMRP